MDVFEIKQAIKELSTKDQWELSEWFQEFMADEWDKQIERDVKAGKLDRFFAQADNDAAAGRLTPL
jgi:hypothetical protein